MIRVTGLTTWYLLVADVIVGMMLTGAMSRTTFPRVQKMYVHAVLGVALVIAAALHVGLVLALHYHGWGVIDVSNVSWRYTVAHNAGVVAWWLILVTLVTAIARNVIDRTTWTVMHKVLPFGVLLVGTVHAFFAGKDGFTWPILIPAVAALTLIASVGIVRWNTTRTRKVYAHSKGKT